MHTARFGIILLCGFVVLMSGPPNTIPVAEADNAGNCSALAKAALDAAKQSCGATTAGSVCFGYDSVKAAFSSTGDAAFKAAGDQIKLANVSSLTTSAANPDSKSWGVAVLNIQAGATNIAGVLFGDSTLTSDIRAGGSDSQTLPVTTAGGVVVLLRGGAGSSYPSALKLTPGQNAVVDGRNKAGDWLRVRLDNGAGWAYAPQIRVTGDAKTLPVLDEQDTRADFLYKNPMQAVTLASGPAGKCGVDAPSGLLLQVSGDQAAQLLINGVDLALSAGTFSVRATPKDRMEVAALAGSATVTAMGNPVTLNTGEWTRIRLGGKDGLLAAAAPTGKANYPFAAVDGAPVAALPGDVACTVGLPGANARVAVRVGPGQERGPLFFMRPVGSYKVSGWANDSKGAPWWKIDIQGVQQAWVDQAAVHSFGACGQVAQAEVPPVIVAAPPPAETGGDNNNPAGGDNAGNQGETGATSFAPTTATIWNVTPGLDKLVGSCDGVAAINYCPSLVQITPRGTGLSFKGQELTPYPMYRVRDNVYAYSGPAPAALGPGTIKLTLVFTSQTNWTVTRVLVFNSAPDCQHVYTFTGTFLR